MQLLAKQRVGLKKEVIKKMPPNMKAAQAFSYNKPTVMKNDANAHRRKRYNQIEEIINLDGDFI